MYVWSNEIKKYIITYLPLSRQMEQIEIYKGFNARMRVSVKTRRGGKHKPASHV